MSSPFYQVMRHNYSSLLGRAGCHAIWSGGLVVAMVSCGSSSSPTTGIGAGDSGTGGSSSGSSGSGSGVDSGPSSGSGTSSGGPSTEDGGETSSSSGASEGGGIEPPDTGASEDGTVEPADTGAPETGTVEPSDTGTVSPSPYPYIFSCFDDDNTHLSDLMIYTSKDALNWTLLYDTGYLGPTGFMRDPSIMRYTDGKYYVAFTTPPTLACCGDEQSFSIGSSSNLKDWTTIATVPCGVAGTKNTWSPEWFVDTDGSVHLTATLDLSIYHYEPTDATLTKWGPPTAMNISGTLDAQVLKIGSTYHMILPNRHGTAPSFNGPWTWNNNLLPPACKEGPAMVHISGDTWRYYCDDGGNGHESTSLTTDLFQSWSPLVTLPVVGNNMSQGTVIRGDTGHPF
jgi:hypothetical protein